MVGERQVASYAGSSADSVPSSRGQPHGTVPTISGRCTFPIFLTFMIASVLYLPLCQRNTARYTDSLQRQVPAFCSLLSTVQYYAKTPFHLPCLSLCSRAKALLYIQA